MISLFLTALLQVSFVAMNVTFISKGDVASMLTTGFLTSFVWTFNVKRIAMGTMKDRLAYSFGAMAGTGLGYYLSHLLTRLV